MSFILTLATCGTNAWHQLQNKNQGWEFFLSLTNLCFLFMAIYFLAAASLSFNDWRKKRYAYFVSVPGGNSITESLLFGSSNIMEDDDMQLELPAPLGHKVFWVMFEVGFSIAVFIDIIFWTTIRLDSTPDLLVVILHALNGVLMIGELFFNSLVFVPSHVFFVWLALLAYGAEVFIWHKVGGEWAYPFLDPANKMAKAYYPVLVITVTVTFFIGFVLVKLRDRNKTRRFQLNVQDSGPFLF